MRNRMEVKIKIKDSRAYVTGQAYRSNLNRLALERNIFSPGTVNTMQGSELGSQLFGTGGFRDATAQCYDSAASRARSTYSDP